MLTRDACYLYRVSVPRVLLIVLALLQATGLAESFRRQACAIECRDDGCGGDCDTGLEASACPCHCPATATLAAPEIVVSTPDLRTSSTLVALIHAERPPAQRDPNEILHVPRATI